MTPHPKLKSFLSAYSQEIQELALSLRGFILEQVPETNELIWDNYNALAIAYSKSDKLKDAFCHIALYTNHVNFGFNRGAELRKDLLTLEGKGTLIRHIKVTSMDLFPEAEIKTLLYDAVSIAETINPDILDGNIKAQSIVMSVSKRKIRPNSKT